MIHEQSPFLGRCNLYISQNTVRLGTPRGLAVVLKTVTGEGVEDTIAALTQAATLYL